MTHPLAQISEPQEFLLGVWICLGAASLVVIGPATVLLVIQFRERRRRRLDERRDRGFDVTPPKDLP
jgi:hypothetical protein